MRREYGRGNATIEKQINSDLQWVPTYFWKTPNGYIACEVNARPLPKPLTQYWGEISSLGLYCRLIVVVPEPGPDGLSLSEYRKDIKKLKELGIGCVCVNNDNTTTIENQGVPIPAQITAPNYSRFKAKLRPIIKHAFDVYMGGDPRLGVQDLGQVIENITFRLADQAIRKGSFRSGGYGIGMTTYPWGNLLDAMTRERVIDCGVLGRCRAFAPDRNSCSHRPRTIAQARSLCSHIKGYFEQSLRILEDLPVRLKERGYKLQVDN